MARRGSGEGSIYRRQDGRWTATVSLPGGRKQQVYGRTRKEVAGKLADLVADRQDGRIVIGPDPALAEYLSGWLEARQHGIRPWTYRGYRTQIAHIIPILGTVKLRELTPEHVAALVAARLQAGASPKHVRGCHQCLRTALADAVRTKRVRINVASREVLSRGILPKAKRYRINPFTRDETRLFLAAAEGDPLEPLYSLAIRSGMRQAELLGLTWDDVDFEHGRVVVTRSLQRIDGVLQFVDVKSDTARRPIEVSPATMAVLRAHRGTQVEARLRRGRSWKGFRHDGQPVELVFCTRDGLALEARNVTRSFKRFLARHKLRQIRFHDLRHTHATLLLQAGEHPKVVQERLGHSSITITLDTYSHLIPSMQAEAATRLESLLS